MRMKPLIIQCLNFSSYSLNLSFRCMCLLFGGYYYFFFFFTLSFEIIIGLQSCKKKKKNPREVHVHFIHLVSLCNYSMVPIEEIVIGVIQIYSDFIHLRVRACVWFCLGFFFHSNT